MFRPAALRSCVSSAVCLDLDLRCPAKSNGGPRVEVVGGGGRLRLAFVLFPLCVWLVLTPRPRGINGVNETRNHFPPQVCAWARFRLHAWA